MKMERDINEINEQIMQESSYIKLLFNEIHKVIVGQDNLIQSLMIALLTDGHILIEGVPGLAKTMTVLTLSKIINVSFKRIQFTPDLLPADLIGTQVFNPAENKFYIKKGPIFANIILADEINRAPAKVQSALLEAMQERQVTIGDSTFQLPFPFLVLATQNPIEQEGTYPLPEAQIDRFMLKVKVNYPSKEEEKIILERMSFQEPAELSSLITPAHILKSKEILKKVYFDEKIKDYIIEIVFATREPAKYKGLKDLGKYIEYGASPRASIYLAKVARAYAFLKGRGYVTPDDIKEIGFDVLRHRIIVTYEAEAEGITSETIIRTIFNEVEVP